MSPEIRGSALVEGVDLSWDEVSIGEPRVTEGTEERAELP